MAANLTSNTFFVKTTALSLGFDEVGIAKAMFLEDDARRLESWLSKGFNGTMAYMNNYFDLRTNPQKLLPGAKSVITFLYNYFPKEKQQADFPKISKYAYGTDYHEEIRKKLHELIFRLREKFGDFAGRGFVDSAPVLERAWAQKSSLGFIGKNGNLINKKKGSFFFIATLIVDIDLEPDVPLATDHCGTCSRCINACPTEAILPNKVIDGSKCISYFTIELKDAIIPEEMKGKFDGWMFGCDVCQDVCPWNRFSKPHQHQELQPLQQILEFDLNDWLQLSEENFRKYFKNSPLRRTKFSGIQRNLQFLKKTSD